MHGVKFGNAHSYDDWGLYLKSRPVISPPVPKTTYIDVPGMDGQLDVSESLAGETKYKNRMCQCEFVLIEKREEWSELCSKIMNYLHGKTMKLILDEDFVWFYEGRFQMNEWRTDKSTATVVIEGNVYPYKKKINKTVVTAAINGNSFINCPNERMSTVPTITVDGNVLISFGDIQSLALSSGTHQYPDIKFVEGDNQIVCSGNGTITFTYQEGSL